MRLVCMAVCCCFLANVFSQKFAIEKFVGDRPLPSNETYDMEEDDFGNKWVASDVGLIKITGNKVSHLTRKDGLWEDVVLDLHKGKNNRIWASGVNGGISLIRNDSIITLPVNRLLEKEHRVGTMIYTMAEDQRGNFYFCYSMRMSTIFVLTAESGYTAYKVLVNKSGIPYNLQIGEHLVRMMLPSLNILAGNKLHVIDHKQKGSFFLEQEDYCINSEDSLIYLSSTDELIELKNYRFSRSVFVGGRIIRLCYIDGKLHIGKWRKGYCYMAPDGNLVCENNVLSDKSVSSILKDREGNYWFTTIGKGIYLCRSPQFKNLYESENGIQKLVRKGNGVCVLLENNTLLFPDGAYKKIKITGPWDFEYQVNDILYIPTAKGTQEYLLTDRGLYGGDATGGYKLVSDTARFIKRFAKLNETDFLVVGSYTFGVKENDSLRYVTTYENFGAAIAIDDSTVWVGSLNSGIHVVAKQNGKWLYRQRGPKYRINHFCETENKTIAVGSNEYGVILLDRKGKYRGKITGTPARIQALEYAHGKIYIGTKEGLYIHDFATHKNRFLNSSNLIPFDEVIDLEIVEDTLYVAGKYQVLKIGIADLQALVPDIHIRIGEVTVNEVPWHSPTLDSLSHDQNYFLFSLQNSSHRAAKNLLYTYSIFEGNALVSTHATGVDFFTLYLRPGNYRLVIQAEDLSTGTLSNKIMVFIRIRPAFYQTGWFLLLVIFLSIVLLTVLFYVSIKTIKLREYRKRKLMEKMYVLENVALQNQMNPHFIFNAINSIQSYILGNDREKAHHYLSEFAKVVRLTLDHSRKKSVSIEEEMKLLRIYVALEEQRIRDKIHLELVVRDPVNVEETCIPALLLQPIVENAIWHGLAGGTGEKRIKMRFYVENNHLAVEVEDNGQGLSESDTLHQSHGLNIIRERLRLLYRKEPDFIYFNMQNTVGHTGVTVKIILPFQSETWE